MKTLKELVRQHVNKDDSVVDFGCGIQNHTLDLQCKSYLGVDAYTPYLEKVRFRPTLKMDIAYCDPFFIDKSYDVVLCLDVIEHLEMNQAVIVLNTFKRIASKKVVIFTTDGFVKQEDGHGWGSNNPEWQKHRCGFSQNDLTNLGFKVTKELGGLFAVKEFK